MSEHYQILDSVVGWRAASLNDLTVTKPDGDLTLEPLPGSARLVLETDAHEKGDKEFPCPTALAVEPGRRLLVVDAALNRVKRITFRSETELKEKPHSGSSDIYLGRMVETLMTMGEEGEDPRQFRQPRGVAVLPSGGVVVADSGNHRVQVFAPPPYALLQVWGAIDPLGHPVAGKGLKEFRYPSAVATDRYGTVYVVDQGNHRIQKIAQDGSRVEEIGKRFLRRPSRLAVGANGVLAVVDSDQDAVFLFAANRALPRMLPCLEAPRSVAFDNEGRLYIGDAIGRIHVLTARPESSLEYQIVGVGVTGVVGEIVNLVWERSPYLLAIIREKTNGHRQRLWWVDPRGACVREGGLVLKRLDSKIERGQWHRIALKAEVPEGASIQIESYTSEDSRQDVSEENFKGWKSCTLSGDSDPDCLVQSGPGRYLWLRVTFRSNGWLSPSVRWIKIFYPRNSYLQYLPAVYQEDEDSRLFLDRFLSIFQTEFDDIDRQIDNLWQLFDSGSPAELVLRKAHGESETDGKVPIEQRRLQWLASWLAVTINPDWKEPKLRDMVKKAFRAYLIRGTVKGVEEAIKDYTGLPYVKVLEHYRLRRWPALSVTAPLDGSVRLWSRDFYKRLQVSSYSQIGYFQLTGVPEPGVEPLDWGANKFSVFFPADPYKAKETKKKVGAPVEREKPAHTEAILCPVYPRFRVGVQATVGVDTAVGGISHLVLNHVATLSYDTILGCSVEEQHIRKLGTSPRPRVGISARLP